MLDGVNTAHGLYYLSVLFLFSRCAILFGHLPEMLTELLYIIYEVSSKCELKFEIVEWGKGIKSGATERQIS